jgi:dTDP-4-dehydrorhamnose reductase
MRTLIVGSGFVGGALARRLEADPGSGDAAVLASRRPPAAVAAPGRGAGAPQGPESPAEPRWLQLDVTDADASARAVQDSGADTIVLVHGPSDVTWCAAHPEEALHGHLTAARNMARAADGRRTILISTDNVFDGSVAHPFEDTPTAPNNAYGRAKLAAEQVFAELPEATVLRVSLIYGWESGETGKWLNFFASCALKLRASEAVEAPVDQWTTPVLLEDVVEVTAALARAAETPPLLHLGGPDRLSRAEWAVAVAEAADADTGLVHAVPRASGRYADRPENSCLASHLLTQHPATAGVRVRGAYEGTRVLFEQAALAEVGGVSR